MGRMGRVWKQRTFSPISELDVRGSLHSSKGIEELGAVGADAEGKGDAETKADD